MANANASTGLAALAAVVEHLHAEELATAHAEVVAARAEVVAARAEAARNNAMLVEVRMDLVMTMRITEAWRRLTRERLDEITRLRAQLREQ